MKTILVSILFLISTSIYGQRYAVYASLLPADLGTGVRADLGYAYGSVSYGNWGVYKETYIRDHWKVTVGAIIPMEWIFKRSNEKDFKASLIAGANYHNAKYPEYITEKLKGTLSWEAGFSVYIQKFAIGARTDFRRGEPCIDIGLTF